MEKLYEQQNIEALTKAERGRLIEKLFLVMCKGMGHTVRQNFTPKIDFLVNDAIYVEVKAYFSLNTIACKFNMTKRQREKADLLAGWDGRQHCFYIIPVFLIPKNGVSITPHIGKPSKWATYKNAWYLF